MFLVITGCAGTPRVYDPGPFTYYVERFMGDAAAVGRPVQIYSLVVKFGDLSANPRRLGVCQTGGGQPNTVTIDQAYWPTLTDAEKVALMYHELGHCVLFRPHNEEFKSFMYQYIHEDMYIRTFFPELVQELFSAFVSGPEYSDRRMSFNAYIDGCTEEEYDHDL